MEMNKRIFVKQDPMKEGIIELRRNVPDLSLGNNMWARVRIRIGRSNYAITGTAIYSDDIPDGYDIVFYTSFNEAGQLKGVTEDINGSWDKKDEFKIIDMTDAHIWGLWALGLDHDKKYNGWQCPICKKVYSPEIKECKCSVK